MLPAGRQRGISGSHFRAGEIVGRNFWAGVISWFPHSVTVAPMPSRCLAVSLTNRCVVFGGEVAIRSSGGDFHNGSAELMKAEGRAPTVAEFAVLVDGWVIRGNESEFQEVVTRECFGDLGIRTGRVTRALKVGPPVREDFAQNAHVLFNRAVRIVEFVSQR